MINLRIFGIILRGKILSPGETIEHQILFNKCKVFEWMWKWSNKFTTIMQYMEKSILRPCNWFKPKITVIWPKFINITFGIRFLKIQTKFYPKDFFFMLTEIWPKLFVMSFFQFLNIRRFNQLFCIVSLWLTNFVWFLKITAQIPFNPSICYCFWTMISMENIWWNCCQMKLLSCDLGA